MYMFTFVGYVVISQSFVLIDDITTFRVISSQKTGAISLQNGLKNAYHIFRELHNQEIHKKRFLFIFSHLK